MTYFVTGATGFIGRYLVQSLLQKGKGTIYVLVRPRSIGKLDELREFWGADSRKRVVPVKGDLGLPKLGVGKADVAKLKGKIKHFYHLGAVYDIEASAEAMEKANITGTKGALEFAEAVNAGCFHLVSSIAAAGLYRGTFSEDMFEEAEELDHPYHRTKHDSEAMVRANGRVPFRVYRPGAVLGHSQTGFIDKIDGPYCSGCASHGRAGCRWSASKAATSTSCRSTSSSTRWCTSRTSRSSTAAASTSPIPRSGASARS
jgi:thioester reductase-like protein